MEDMRFLFSEWIGTDMPFRRILAFGAHLAHGISRPFSISNPADRVFFLERTFMCLVDDFRIESFDYDVPIVSNIPKRIAHSIPVHLAGAGRGEGHSEMSRVKRSRHLLVKLRCKRLCRFFSAKEIGS
jgi:hypothetical protein